MRDRIFEGPSQIATWQTKRPKKAEGRSKKEGGAFFSLSHLTVKRKINKFLTPETNSLLKVLLEPRAMNPSPRIRATMASKEPRLAGSFLGGTPVHQTRTRRARDARPRRPTGRYTGRRATKDTLSGERASQDTNGAVRALLRTEECSLFETRNCIQKETMVFCNSHTPDHRPLHSTPGPRVRMEVGSAVRSDASKPICLARDSNFP